jgi:hypothetical protein
LHFKKKIVVICFPSYAHSGLKEKKHESGPKLFRRGRGWREGVNMAKVQYMHV